jgi:UDP-glucose 4-epimerase
MHATREQSPETSSLAERSCCSPTRWLITGGCGFIGCNLIKCLLARSGHYIRILDNLSVGLRSDLARVCTFAERTSQPFGAAVTLSDENHDLPHSPRVTENDCVPVVELMVGDIRGPHVCLEAARNINVIVHLAANTGVAPSVENPLLDMESNVIGTVNMLEAARHNQVKRFIFASSGAPIGECEPPIHEELAPRPVSPYGASKLAGEGYCSAYSRTFGLETVSLRFGNVYGPLSSHKTSVVAKFIRHALAGEVCEIYGDGAQTRDFVYIDDLIEAIMKAAFIKPLSGFPTGEVFQIAGGMERTVNEMAELLRGILYQKLQIEMKINHGASRLGDVRRNYSRTAKAQKILNWRAQIELREGLDRTIDWFLSNMNNEAVATP